MYIYRIEDKKGYGIWASGHGYLGQNKLPNTSADIPEYHKRGAYDWRHGTQNKRDLQRWINRQDRLEAFERGLRVAVYKVPDDAVLKGSVQVIFDPKRAQRVAEFNDEGWLQYKPE